MAADEGDATSITLASASEEVRALWTRLDLPETAKTLAADVSIRPVGGKTTRTKTRPDDVDALDGVLAELPFLDVRVPSEGVSAEWLLREELGRGGMGVVSRAEQRSLGRDVAIKHLGEGRQRTANKRALVDEARVLGKLSHPNIVPVHALGTDGEGRPMLVMKRVEGARWADVLADPAHELVGDDRLGTHIGVLLQVCRAIEYAHSRGLVHRDLKPDNVMLGDFGEIYVLDWGVACTLGDVAEGPLSKNADASLVGTPCYMAPEMLRRGAVSERTDVFLLGAVLYEVLTGAPPHKGDNLYEILFAVASSEPREYPRDVPRDLVAICERALSSRPEDRHPSAAAFREDLAGALRHRASTQLTGDALERLDAATDAEMSAKIWQALWECRFGLRQALDMWAENEAAQRGLRRCLEQMVTRAIEARDDAMARSLLEELGADEALEGAVQGLEEDLASEREQVGRLRDVADHHDVEMRQALRGRQLLSMCAANAALGVAAIIALHGFGFTPTYPILLAVGLMPPPIVGFFSFVKRSQHSPVSARLLWAFLVMTLIALFMRVIGWRLGVPLHAAIAFELAGDSLAATVTAILVDRRLTGPAVFCCGCSALTLVFPELSITLLLAGVTLGLTWAGLIWRKDAAA